MDNIDLSTIEAEIDELNRKARSNTNFRALVTLQLELEQLRPARTKRGRIFYKLPKTA